MRDVTLGRETQHCPGDSFWLCEWLNRIVLTPRARWAVKLWSGSHLPLAVPSTGHMFLSCVLVAAKTKAITNIKLLFALSIMACLIVTLCIATVSRNARFVKSDDNTEKIRRTSSCTPPSVCLLRFQLITSSSAKFYPCQVSLIAEERLLSAALAIYPICGRQGILVSCAIQSGPQNIRLLKKFVGTLLRNGRLRDIFQNSWILAKVRGAIAVGVLPQWA